MRAHWAGKFDAEKKVQAVLSAVHAGIEVIGTYDWTKSSFAEFLVEWILPTITLVLSVSHSFVQNSMAPLTTAPRSFCVQVFCALTNQAEARNTAPYLGAEDPHEWGSGISMGISWDIFIYISIYYYNFRIYLSLILYTHTPFNSIFWDCEYLTHRQIGTRYALTLQYDRLLQKHICANQKLDDLSTWPPSSISVTLIVGSFFFFSKTGCQKATIIWLFITGTPNAAIATSNMNLFFQKALFVVACRFPLVYPPIVSWKRQFLEHFSSS